jgi:hypothetical protein
VIHRLILPVEGRPTYLRCATTPPWFLLAGLTSMAALCRRTPVRVQGVVARWRHAFGASASSTLGISAGAGGGELMAGVYDAIRVLALEHRGCGELRGDAELLTPEGYEECVRCSCGARLEQWVSPAVAEADLLHSALLAFEH